MTNTEQWTTFFLEAGISPNSAILYANTFVENQMERDLMQDMDKGDLRYGQLVLLPLKNIDILFQGS